MIIRKDTSQLSRSQKILIALFILSEGKSAQIRFEDIAVKAFNLFPADFQLKGYPKYPDTGDIIHKPLYSELKKNGFVLSGNKYFSLTQKGAVYAKDLVSKSDNAKGYSKVITPKLTADLQKELDRLKSSKAVELFMAGKRDEILDIDLFSYLEVTVRTNKYDFLGRLKTVEDAIKATKTRSDKLYEILNNCHLFLMERFKDNINYFRNMKGGNR